MDDLEFELLNKLTGDLFYLIGTSIFKKYTEYKTISDNELVKILLRKDLCDEDLGSIIKFILNNINNEVLHYKYQEQEFNFQIDKSEDVYYLDMYKHNVLTVIIKCSEKKIHLINMF